MCTDSDSISNLGFMMHISFKKAKGIMYTPRSTSREVLASITVCAFTASMGSLEDVDRYVSAGYQLESTEPGCSVLFSCSLCYCSRHEKPVVHSLPEVLPIG